MTVHKGSWNDLLFLMELEESSGYWSEYDVQIGIVERIKEAITKATTGN